MAARGNMSSEGDSQAFYSEFTRDCCILGLGQGTERGEGENGQPKREKAKECSGRSCSTVVVVQD